METLEHQRAFDFLLKNRASLAELRRKLEIAPDADWVRRRDEILLLDRIGKLTGEILARGESASEKPWNSSVAQILMELEAASGGDSEQQPASSIRNRATALRSEFPQLSWDRAWNMATCDIVGNRGGNSKLSGPAMPLSRIF